MKSNLIQFPVNRVNQAVNDDKTLAQMLVYMFEKYGMEAIENNIEYTKRSYLLSEVLAERGPATKTTTKKPRKNKAEKAL